MKEVYEKTLCSEYLCQRRELEKRGALLQCTQLVNPLPHMDAF